MDEDFWDPSNHAGMRQRIEQGTVEEISKTFPVSYGGVRLEAENVRITGPDRFSLKEQRKALLSNSYLAKPLKADVVLRDEKTGEELDRRVGATLMRVPYYTDRGTFIHNGNEYTGVMQSRLIPGAYTRVQTNGGIETQFNTRVGTGRPFRVALDPETAQFRLRVKGSDLHLYSVLKDAGVPDEDMIEAWGEEVWKMNSGRYDVRAAKKAYEKLVSEYSRKNLNLAPGDGIREALNRAQISDEAASRTLGAYWRSLSKKADNYASIYELYVRPRLKLKTAAALGMEELGLEDEDGDRYRTVGFDGVLASTRKLLAVNRKQDNADDRNVPAFSKIFTLDKLLRERIRLDDGKRRRQMVRLIANRKNLSPLAPRVFDGYYEEFLTKNPLTTPIEQTNPLQIMSQHRRVTQMGPGGIGSADAITPDMQASQASEFGFISAYEGPECFPGSMQVLTDRGWLPWSEVDDHDFFACRDEDGEVAWRAADRVVREEYRGPLVVVETDDILMRVTPTHRVLFDAGGEDVVLAFEAMGGNGFIPTIRGSIPVNTDAWRQEFFIGTVFCATVPGGLLLVRGKDIHEGFWSGNSEKAGIDVRLSAGVVVGRDGRIRRRLRNLRTGNEEWVSPHELWGKALKLPD